MVQRHPSSLASALLQTFSREPYPRLLDYPCGTGDITRDLAKKLPDTFVIGADPDYRNVNDAEWGDQPGNVSYNCQPLASPPAEYKAATMAFGLPTVGLEGLQQYREWIADGGELVMMEYHAEGIRRRIADGWDLAPFLEKARNPNAPDKDFMKDGQNIRRYCACMNKAHELGDVLDATRSARFEPKIDELYTNGIPELMVLRLTAT